MAPPLRRRHRRLPPPPLAASHRTHSAPPQTRPPPAPARLPPELQGLAVEDLQLCSEASSSSHPQAWVPVRLAKRAGEPPGRRLPVAVLLHSTGSDMGSLAGQQAELARRGYLAAALDCRYHGARSAGGGASAGRQLARMVSFARDEYQAALVAAWRGSGERPFLLDNVWDVLRLLDYLEQRCVREGDMQTATPTAAGRSSQSLQPPLAR